MILNSLIMTGEKSIEVSSLTSAEQTYHLSRINAMMDSWSNERLTIFQVSVTNFPLTATQGVYSIGSGGNFNMTRPTKIVDPCFIRDTDGNDIPLTLLDYQAYGAIVDKDADGSFPVYLYYEPSYSATSTAQIKLWPEPVANLTLFINTIQPLTTFSTMTHPVSLPPGYQDAIETNYAMKSALGLMPISPDLREAAVKSKANIKTTNSFSPIMRLDYAVQGGMRSNILTGP